MAKPPVAWFLLLPLSLRFYPLVLSFSLTSMASQRGLRSPLRGRLLGLGRRGDGAEKRAAASLQRGGGNATPPTAAAAALAAAAAELLLRPPFAVRRKSCCWRRRRGWPRRQGAASLKKRRAKRTKGSCRRSGSTPQEEPRRKQMQANRIEFFNFLSDEKKKNKKKLPVFKCASPWPASRRPRPGQSPAGPSEASTLARTCGAATKSRKTAGIGEGLMKEAGGRRRQRRSNLHFSTPTPSFSPRSPLPPPHLETNSKNSSRRTWKPNVQHKSLWLSAAGKHVRLPVTTTALRTIDKAAASTTFC